jgi:hypothetical protein
LERVAGGFASHLVCRYAAQFLIDVQQEFLGGLGVPLRNGIQDARDFTHAPFIHDCVPMRKPGNGVPNLPFTPVDQ